MSAERGGSATDKTVEAALKQLQLGESQLDQERAALSASIRPIIADIPQIKEAEEAADWARHVIIVDHDDMVRLSVPVRNIGPGHEPSSTTHS